VIYIDSSVLLADLFAEPRSPPEALWEEDLVASRLLAYEVWSRIHAVGLTMSHHGRARSLLSRISLTEMSQAVLARALVPFPVAVRTLDALHLATIEFLRGQDEVVELATYDMRLVAAARALGISLTEL
jgi:uncharacterized protein